MNIIHDIDKARITADKFTAVIEISRGSRLKYEIDKETGMLALDRVLKTSMVYPANYGFIPRTLSEDGDPLDVMIYMEDAVQPMSLIDCRPVGYVEMVDNGEMDEKILAVPCFSELKEVPQDFINQVVHFSKEYKALQKNKDVKINKVGDTKAAKQIINDAIKLYEKGASKK